GERADDRQIDLEVDPMRADQLECAADLLPKQPNRRADHGRRDAYDLGCGRRLAEGGGKRLARKLERRAVERLDGAGVVVGERPDEQSKVTCRQVSGELILGRERRARTVELERRRAAVDR